MQNSAQSELRISGNLRNGERPESGSAETEGNRERDPISEGLSPLHHYGSQGLEGKHLSHLGGRSRKKKKEGGLSPPRFRWHRSATGGHHHHRNLHQQLHRHHHQLFPPSMQRCNPSFTRYNLYLNMGSTLYIIIQ